MKYQKPILLFSIYFLAVSCGGGSGGGSGNSSNLTGVWRSEFNNILYLFKDNGTTVEIENCNSEEPFTLNKTNGNLEAGGLGVYKINSTTQLEISQGKLTGIKINKVNNNDSFNSGNLSILSSNITDLSTSIGVCAYRETDDIFNILVSPYEGSYLKIIIGVDSKATGNHLIPTNASITLESTQLPSPSIYASFGNVNVTEYTDVKLKADFQFTASDGNSYSGSIDVDL